MHGPSLLDGCAAVGVRRKGLRKCPCVLLTNAGAVASSTVADVALACSLVAQRACLPHSRVMLHQPSGGAQGQASDILIHAQEIAKVRDTINSILVDHTEQERDVIGTAVGCHCTARLVSLHLFPSLSS